LDVDAVLRRVAMALRMHDQPYKRKGSDEYT
jgi:hypothetical protein